MHLYMNDGVMVTSKIAGRRPAYPVFEQNTHHYDYCRSKWRKHDDNNRSLGNVNDIFGKLLKIVDILATLCNLKPLTAMSNTWDTPFAPLPQVLINLRLLPRRKHQRRDDQKYTNDVAGFYFGPSSFISSI